MQRRVDVEQSWPAQDVAAGITEGPRGHRLECGRIEPLIDRLLTLSVADAIRQPGHQISDVVVALRHGERPPRASCYDAAEREAAEDLRGRAARHPFAAFADGNVDNPVGRHTVPRVLI